MPKRLCLTNLITGMTDQGEPVDVVYSKAFDSVSHRLLVKKMVATGIHLKITRWVEELIKNRTFRLKLGGQLSREGVVKSGVLRSKKPATRAEVIN